MYEILDSKNIKYETESTRIKYFDTVKNKIRVAIPDIIIGKLLLEIKSTYTYDFQNMSEKFVEYKKHGYRPILIMNGKLYWTLPNV